MWIPARRGAFSSSYSHRIVYSLGVWASEGCVWFTKQLNVHHSRRAKSIDNKQVDRTLHTYIHIFHWATNGEPQSRPQINDRPVALPCVGVVVLSRNSERTICWTTTIIILLVVMIPMDDGTKPTNCPTKYSIIDVRALGRITLIVHIVFRRPSNLHT